MFCLVCQWGGGRQGGYWVLTYRFLVTAERQRAGLGPAVPGGGWLKLKGAAVPECVREKLRGLKDGGGPPSPALVRVNPLGRTEPDPESSRLDGLLHLSGALLASGDGLAGGEGRALGGVEFQGFGWNARGQSQGEAEVPQRSKVSG